MNVKNDSTGTPGDASEWQKLANVFERRQGLLSRVDAAHHLSRCLMGDLDSSFATSRAVKIDGITRTYHFVEPNIETMQWLISEIWEAAVDMRAMIDELYERVNAAQGDE